MARSKTVGCLMMGLAALVAMGLLVCSSFADATLHIVSQRGRAFQPGAMTLNRGDTLQIVNDDGDLLHHAYIEDERFSFDSGDQKPGSKTNVTFSQSGEFTILCGIHPKMKMVVTVQP